MANVTLSVTETAVNVSTTTSNITVTDSDGGQTFNVTTTMSNIAVTSPVTNVVVSETAGVSAEEVRSYISNTSPILYDVTSGVISFDSNASFNGKTTDDLAEGTTNLYFLDSRARAAISATAPILYDSANGVISIDNAAIDIANANVTLREFHETIYDNGNISGAVTFDLHNGTIHRATIVANVTSITFANVTAGSGITLLIQQDTIGNWVIDPAGLTNWEFVGNIKVIDNQPSSNSMIVVTYDGDKYKSSWIKFDAAGALDLSNNTTSDLAEGTNLYFTAARARGNVSAVDAGGYGSFTYSSSTGQFTYTGPSDANIRSAISVVDAGGDGSLSYNSGTGVITYTGPSQAEANSRIDARLSATSPIVYSSGVISLSGTANITTTGNISGGYFIGNGSLLTGVTSLTNAQVLAYIATQPLTVGGNLDVLGNINATGPLTVGGNLDVSGNINATGNINYQNVTDLYVTDQKITLNSNAATNANVEVIAYRPEATDTKLKWNESTDRWTFTNDGSTYYNLATSTTDVAEGTNLYYTTDRANTAIGNYTGDMLNVGAITANSDITLPNNNALKTLYVKALSADLELHSAPSAPNATFSIGQTTDSVLTTQNNFRITTAGSNNWYFYNTGRFVAPGNIETSGNIQSNYFIGNGSLLTGIIASAEANSNNQSFNLVYQGSDSRLYYDSSAEFTFNPATNTVALGPGGYLTIGGGNALIGNVDVTSLLTGVNASFTGTVIGGYFDGDGSNLDGITTTIVSEGTNLYFTTTRVDDHLNTSTANTNQVLSWTGSDYDWVDQTGGSTYGDSNVTALLANLGSNVISSSANIITTGNIDVANLVNVTSITSVNAFTSILMDSINPNEIIIGKNFGSKLFFPTGGSPSAGVGQYLRIGSTSAAGATFSVENFGLSFENIGTFGGPGDPANISFFQSSSVMRAGLTGDVGDITVNSVTSGDTGWIVVYQDATGGRNLTLGSSWKMEGCTTGNPVPIAKGANEESLIFWTYDGTNYRGTVTPNIGSNVSVDIKTTGNVEGNYFIGNGSLLTGITASGGNYGDSNVTTLLANLGSNVISSDANITTTGNLTTTAKTVSLITNTERYNIVGANTSAKNTYYVAGSNDTYELPGWHVRWEGTEDANVLFPDNGDTNIDCIQMSVAQFTGNTYQGSGDPDLLSSLGPRLLFTSYNGKRTDATNTWYPRVGQEIGRIGFLGPRQNNANPDTLYLDNNFISVVASEDWTTRSPADMYLIARSKGSNSLAPFAWASHQGGNVMLSSSGTNGTSAPPGNIRLSYQASIFNGVAYGSQDNAFMDFAVAGFDDVSTFPGKGVKLVATNGPGGASAINGNYRLGIERNNNSAGMDSTQSWHFTLPSGSNDLILQSNTSSNVATFYTNGNVGIAGTVTATAFIGDGSDVTDVRAKTVEEKVINKSGGTLAKGTPVYATGGVTSDALWVAPCDASNAATIPCIGVLATSLDNDVEGRAIITGTISGVDTSAFTAGDQIYVAVGGGYANVAPAGEANIVQFLGTVTRVDASQGGGVVKIAPPRNERNLNSGNVFIGDGSNFTVTKPLVTAITDANVKLKQFAETVVDLGNVSGDISANIDVANGTIYKMSTTGSITINSLASATAGTSATLIITNGGSHTLSSTMKFAGGSKTLSTGAGDIDIVSVFYDGSTYYATLSKGYA